MGSQAATDSFLRLFLIPGVTHGVETGSGAGRIVHFYDYIQAWVENGTAPDYLIGGKYNNTNYPSSNSEELLFERKHFAYPYASQLIEGMDQDVADSWEKVDAEEVIFWPRSDDL